jgi:glycosyltransferase involved in cell wall biosynthesis
MPLIDDEWAQGKCAFKLIQYMACGIPVIASHVGANADVVTPECGFLARTSSDWERAFEELYDHPEIRYAMGRAGRARVEKHYSLANNAQILASAIISSTRKVGSGPSKNHLS